MSDYLRNLVARNLGWANTVQPRKRSLFEPAAEKAGTVWSSPQLEEIESGESIPLDRVEDSLSGAKQQPPSSPPSSFQLDSNLCSEIPTISPTARGEQLTPPTGNSSDLALDSVPQQSVFEPIATPANPPQLQRQINTPNPPSFSATESDFTATAQPNPAGLIQQGRQGSRQRGSSIEPNSIATEQTNSQLLSPTSSVPNLSTLPPVNITEKKYIIPTEPWDLSPDLTQSLPLQSNEENDSVELLGEDLQVQSPLSNRPKITSAFSNLEQGEQSERRNTEINNGRLLNTTQRREVNPLDSKGEEERGNISIYSNNIELSPSKIQQTDSELVSPSAPMPKPSTLPSINAIVNRGKELREETSGEPTSNSPQPESAQPVPKPISIPAEAVEETKSVTFLGAESQLARPMIKVAQPQVNSLVAQARSPSLTAREQPTIRVSIGRIEVQAIAENQPWKNLPPKPLPAPPKPAVPRLSLEEYLKSRQGGRR